MNNKKPLLTTLSAYWPWISDTVGIELSNFLQPTVVQNQSACEAVALSSQRYPQFCLKDFLAFVEENVKVVFYFTPKKKLLCPSPCSCVVKTALKDDESALDRRLFSISFIRQSSLRTPAVLNESHLVGYEHFPLRSLINFLNPGQSMPEEITAALLYALDCNFIYQI